MCNKYIAGRYIGINASFTSGTSELGFNQTIDHLRKVLSDVGNNENLWNGQGVIVQNVYNNNNHVDGEYEFNDLLTFNKFIDKYFN